jgi:hypothetical protein
LRSLPVLVGACFLFVWKVRWLIDERQCFGDRPSSLHPWTRGLGVCPDYSAVCEIDSPRYVFFPLDAGVLETHRQRRRLRLASPRIWTEFHIGCPALRALGPLGVTPHSDYPALRGRKPWRPTTHVECGVLQVMGPYRLITNSSTVDEYCAATIVVVIVLLQCCQPVCDCRERRVNRGGSAFRCHRQQTRKGHCVCFVMVPSW